MFKSRDPTLDAVGTRSCAIRRGMSKKRATAVFDLSLLSRLCLWKTVVHRYPVDEEQMHRRPQRTRRPIRNWVSVTTPLCLRNGARETREKTRKGIRGVGWVGHITSRDPTLDAGRAPARSGVACPKNVQRQYLTCPSELVCVLRGLL